MKKTFTLFLASLLLSFSTFSQNRGLSFDGMDDRVQIPIRNGVLMGSAITFEAWVRPSSLSGSYMPIVNQGTSGNYFMACFENMSMMPFDPPMINLKVFLYNGSDNVELYYPVSTEWVNQWHHIAVTFDGGTAALYVDGLPVTSAPFSGAIPNSNQSTWLGIGGSGDVFSGTLDEVRVWNVVRTQAEIQAAMNTELPAGTAGLTAYYKFNQGSTDGDNTAITTVADEVAGNNGTLINFARTGTTSNFTVGYSSLAVLAIKDASFTAFKRGGSVQLNWKSLTPDHSSVFTIERSANGIDFNPIGSVYGAPSFTEKSYSFTDAAPMATSNYYRIKSTEADGRTSYTSVLVVAMNKAIAVLQVFPNPASATLQLQVTAPKGEVVVSLKDLAGRTLQTMKLASQGTTIYQSLDISRLAKGMYIVAVGDESTVFVKQ